MSAISQCRKLTEYFTLPAGHQPDPDTDYLKVRRHLIRCELPAKHDGHHEIIHPVTHDRMSVRQG